jgi:hypothetical protein
MMVSDDDKEKVVYMHNRTRVGNTEKKEILLFETTCINLEDMVLSEISQAQKDKTNVITFICGG